MGLNRAQLIEAIQIAERLREIEKTNKLRTYFPDNGPLRRELYPKHMEFFRAGKHHRERCIIAANRIGKTESIGGYEMTLHLTGLYPDWWDGYRFNRPIRAWASGDTSKTTRDIIQHKLIGPIGAKGTGLIPKDKIISMASKQGIADAVEIVRVTHSAGGESQLILKSYDQRREAFQGTEQDVIWLDEEPPIDIYTECLLRTMTNNGLIMLTFTPLIGVSDVVLSYMEGGQFPQNQVMV